MVTAAWDTSNLVALYKDGKQCTSCCGPLFEYETEPGLCCPGFGEDSTPSQYTVKLVGVVDCPVSGASAVNGVWVLDLVECGTPAEEWGCQWRYEAGGLLITFSRAHIISCAEVGVTAWFESSGQKSAFSSLDRYTFTTGYCDIVSNRWLNCTAPRYGKFGTAQFWPGAWPTWAISTAYTTGDMRQNGINVYVCIQPHISAAINEPGVGANWNAFWNVSDPCGDANVGCS